MGFNNLGPNLKIRVGFLPPELSLEFICGTVTSEACMLVTDAAVTAGAGLLLLKYFQKESMNYRKALLPRHLSPLLHLKLLRFISSQKD